MKTLIIIFTGILLSNLLYSQAIFNVKANGQQGDTAYIHYNDTLFLTSEGTEDLLIDEDFTNQTLGALNSNNIISFVDQCKNQKKCAWIDETGSDTIRQIFTNNLVTNSNLIAKFELRCGTQGSSCDGPDMANEGVYLQCSNDSGIVWDTINYWNPGAGYNLQLTSWNYYIDTLNFISSNIKIRWVQNNFSEYYNDNWGISNVKIYSPNYKVLWSTGDTTKNAQGFIPSSDSWYYVKYFNYYNTSFVTDSVYVKRVSPLNVDFTASVPITNDTIYACKNSNITFYSNFTGGTYGIQYYWDFGGGNQMINIPNQYYIFNDYGIYKVKLTARDFIDTISKTITVIVPNPPSFANTMADTTMYCLGDEVILNGNQHSRNSYYNLPRTYTQPVNEFFNFSTPLNSILHISLPYNKKITRHTDVEKITLKIEAYNTNPFKLLVYSPNQEYVKILTENSGPYYDLGLPFPSDDTIQGICYNYKFYENNNVNFLLYPLICNDIHTDTSYIVNGQQYYCSFMDTCNLIGEDNFFNYINSDVNGNWRLELSSPYGYDNGYLSSWSITFDSLFIDNYTQSYDYYPGYWTQENDTTHYPTPFTAITSHLNFNYYTYTVFDNYGCKYDTTIRVFVNACQGVKENEITENSNFSINPNPSKSSINIIKQNELVNEDEIKIFDVNGKLVKKVNTKKTQVNINISDLSQGVYFVKIGSESKKFVKKD